MENNTVSNEVKEEVTVNQAEKKEKKKGNKLIIIFLILLIAAVGLEGYYLYKSKNKPVEQDNHGMGSIVIDGQATDEKRASALEKLSNRYVAFAGMDNATITKDTIVNLENLPQNEDIYMKFIITDVESGKVVKETDLIPAGQHVEWMAGEDLTPGKHSINFSQRPYYLIGDDDYMELTTGNNTVIYTVE